MAVGVTIDGLNNPNGATPPDTQVAVGPSEVIEMVNSTARIWSKSGGTPVATLDLNTLFGIPELVGSDPRILYDTPSGRFFATYVSLNPPPYNVFFGNNTTIQILWSLNSAPTGYADWNGCSYLDTSGQLHDNPALGVSDDKIAIGTDVFSWPAAASDPNLPPLGSDTLLIDKSTALANQTPCPSAYFAHVTAGNIRPGQSLSATAPLFMTSLPEAGGTTATLWTITGTVGAQNLARVRSDLAMAGTTMPPPAVQAGSSNTVETNDARALEAFWKSGSLTVTANTGCGSPVHACLHLLQIDTSSSSVSREVTIGDGTGADLYYPSARPDTANNLIVVYSQSSATSAPGVAALALDPSWSAQASTMLKTGVAPYTGVSGETAPYRWGDYSGAAVDPSDPNVIWAGAEYSHSTTRGDWGTFIAQLHAQAPTTVTPTPTPPPTSTPTATMTATATSTPIGCASGDSDCDGCPDVNELSANPLAGGSRDPHDPWDFFDVPLPPLTSADGTGIRNHIVTIGDVIAILYYVGTADGGPPNAAGVSYNTDLNSNGIPDGREYDRTAGGFADQPWRSGPPSGAVSIGDAIVDLAQVGDNCTAAP